MKKYNLFSRCILIILVFWFALGGLGYIFNPISRVTSNGRIALSSDVFPGVKFIGPFFGAYILSQVALGIYALKNGSIDALKAFIYFSLTLSIVIIIFSTITISGQPLYLMLGLNTIYILIYSYLLFKNKNQNE